MISQLEIYGRAARSFPDGQPIGRFDSGSGIQSEALDGRGDHHLSGDPVAFSCNEQAGTVGSKIR